MVISDSVETLEKSCVNYCQALCSISFGSGISKFDMFAFDNCYITGDLPLNISINNDVLLENFIQVGRGNLVNLTIGSNIKRIDGNCYFTNVENITVLGNLDYIDGYRFYGNTKLKSFVYKGTKPPGYDTMLLPFTGCSQLKAVNVPKEYIGNSFCGLPVIKGDSSTPVGYECGENLLYNIAENGTLIISGEGSMYDYTTFKKAPWKESGGIIAIVIESGVTYIGSFAFEEMNYFTSIIVPKTVTSIGEYAFYNCKKLQEVTVLSNLSYVAGGAFEGCSSLVNFTYNGTTAPKYETGIVDSVFVDCTKLKIINVTEGYTGTDFCEMPITKDTSTKQNWFVKNISWIAPTITAIGGILAIGLNIKKIVKCINEWKDKKRNEKENKSEITKQLTP